MNKKTIKSIMVVLILMVIALYFVSGTYARYTSEFSADATFQVAKWQVKVGDTAADDETSKTFTPTFTYNETEYVANDRIAPSRSASADIEIDLTGTEVAVDVLASVDTSELATSLGTSKITTTATIDDTDVTTAQGTTIALPEKQAFTSSNGKKTLKVTVTWDNDSDNHSSDDTKNGIAAGNIEIPVTVTLKQHIQE